MQPTAEQIAAVEQSLRRTFPDADVASAGFFNTDVQLFRARTPGAQGPALELGVSYEAFEDNAVEAIVAVLERPRVAERLRENPSERLMLDRWLRLRRAPQSARA